MNEPVFRLRIGLGFDQAVRWALVGPHGNVLDACYISVPKAEEGYRWANHVLREHGVHAAGWFLSDDGFESTCPVGEGADPLLFEWSPRTHGSSTGLRQAIVDRLRSWGCSVNYDAPNGVYYVDGRCYEPFETTNAAERRVIKLRLVG